MVAAFFAWGAVVTRELPVVTLASGDSGVCDSWRTTSGRQWSPIQIKSWIRQLAQAAMVQDSRLVKENLHTMTTLLAPPLRAEFRRSEPLRARFAATAKLNVRGKLQELTVNCSEDSTFTEATAPWYCIAYGASEYWPAVGKLPSGQPPFKSYFFIELAIQPGELAMDNPLGLEAREFWPREAETKAELEKMVAEDRL